MSRVVLLTRPGNWQGVRTLDACARRGVGVAAVIVEPKTPRGRLDRIRKYVKVNGALGTARKMWWSLRSDRRFRQELARVHGDRLPLSVSEMAARLGIPFHTVASHNDAQCEGLLREIAPDLVLLSGTRIIKDHIIRQARKGCLNSHTGWLPEYRGVHANLWAFLEGGRRGVTLHYVDTGVDTGAILLREELPILPGDILERIEVRTVELCVKLMLDAIQAIRAGTTAPIPQRPEEGRQYRALPYRKELEVRRRLRALEIAGAPAGMAYERS